MLAERLDKAWRKQRDATAFDAVMRFSSAGLVLGAGTIVAPARGTDRDISIDPEEPRLRALLTAAHLGSPSAPGLVHLSKAAERWGEGEDALAAMHLSLSRLDKLFRPDEDAHRLFLADQMLREGLPPDEVVSCVIADAFEKIFNPNQPRVSAGNGIISGRWAAADGTAGATSAPPTPATRAKAPVRAPSAARNGVLPDMWLPIIGAPACDAATRSCFKDVVRRTGKGAANDNWPEGAGFRCSMASATCNVIAFGVQTIPGLLKGAVMFPDGGIVVLTKDFEDVYYPPGFPRGRGWPNNFKKPFDNGPWPDDD